MRHKYLCVCQYGHSRSVALARLFHGKGEQAVAIGHGTAGSEALLVLARWADRICVLDDGFTAHIPAEFRHKVVSFHVGPDVWVNPYNKELAQRLETIYSEKRGLL